LQWINVGMFPPFGGAQAYPQAPGGCQGYPSGQGQQWQRPPGLGATMQGTVKSYSAKGFGFILCPEIDHDVYFARESLEGGLRTANIAGTVVQFTLQRGLHGKPQAVGLRPLEGQIAPSSYNRGYAAPPPNLNYQAAQPPQGCGSQGFGQGPAMAQSSFTPPSRPGEKPGYGLQIPGGQLPSGFGSLPGGLPMMMAAPAVPKRTVSPHAGSRAMFGAPPKPQADAVAAEKKSSASSSDSEKSSDDDSDSSSSGKKKKKKKKEKKKKGKKDRDRSRSRKRKKSSSDDDRQSVISSDEEPKEAAASASATGAQAEVEDAKREVLQQMENLKKIEPKETRMKEWRSLLRSWHPDKNQERVEVATEVFQFLQKGKRLLNL